MPTAVHCPAGPSKLTPFQEPAFCYDGLARHGGIFIHRPAWGLAMGRKTDFPANELQVQVAQRLGVKARPGMDVFDLSEKVDDVLQDRAMALSEQFDKLGDDPHALARMEQFFLLPTPQQSQPPQRGILAQFWRAFKIGVLLALLALLAIVGLIVAAVMLM